MKQKFAYCSLCLASLLFSCANASAFFDDKKASVHLEATSWSSSGGGGREQDIKVTLQRGFEDKPLPLQQKIKALQQKQAFYALMLAKGIDLEKPVEAEYRNKPLKEIFAELLPGVAIEFKGECAGETVQQLSSKKAKMEQVLEFLDDACGLYFNYKADSIEVSKDPF